MAKVVEACRVANCLDFIQQWPQGFDTVSEPQHLRCIYVIRSYSYVWSSYHCHWALHLKRSICESMGDQVIGERGAQLSGGQRARIALAR